MRAVVFVEAGGPEVLKLVERPVPDPAPGEVRVRVHRSGVNPTDWKTRRATNGPVAFAEAVPNQDGSGVIDAVGPGADPSRVGERVWIWEAAYQRPTGTAQEYVTIPERHAVQLPETASFDVGASLGVPFLTAHRCLTVAEGGPTHLGPGTLEGCHVLVAGGAGAVGNAAIQLARWSGATVLTTVSGPEKAVLATAAGAQHVINYRHQDVAAVVRDLVPGGVDVVVEVSLAVNASIDAAIVATPSVVAVYATDGGPELVTAVRPWMVTNTRWQFVLVYTEPPAAKAAGIADITTALEQGAIAVGPSAGLPVHHFPLERAADAHAAVESSVTGKVLIDVVG
jgi:NADPH2:quinone reductase